MPAKNDATGDSHKITFRSQTFDVPPAEDWDLDVLEAIDESRMTSALRALLGEAQYEKFRAKNKKVRDLREFFEVAGKAVGAGNSSAS